MSDVENMLGHNEFFADTVDTLQEGIEQQRKRECLKGVIGKGEVYLLDGKKQWTHEKVDKAKNKTINKGYAEYEQHELNGKGENTGKALGKPV